MKIENIFIEFMSLYYKSSGTNHNTVKDIPLDSGIIARNTDIGCTIYYLTTGNYIRIPWGIMDLFYSLNTYSGNRILSLDPNNKVERFIQQFIKFINLLNNSTNNSPVLSVFLGILDLGTKDFREWYKEKFNKTLLAIEFFSPDTNLEL